MDRPTLFIVGFFVLGGAGFVWQQMQPPAPVNGHSMTPADLTGLEVGAPIVEVTLPSELSAKAQLGKQVFDSVCAACHGANGAGRNGVAPPLVHVTYQPSHHGEAAFVSAAKNGVISHHWEFGNMPPQRGLTDGDVKMVVAYIRELQQANGIF